MLDATQTQTPPAAPPLATPPASAEAPPPASTAAADHSCAKDCVDRNANRNVFSAELETLSAGKDPDLKPGDVKTYSKVEGDAFRTDAAGNVVPPKHSDVDQGDLGDCWLMAASASIAHQDPEYIQNRITKNDDGTFNVKLGSSTQTVTPTFPDAGYADPTPGNQKDTLWPALIEKAYAQQEGGYAELDGGDSGAAMTALTGKPSTATSLSSSTKADELYKTLKAGKDGDHPMTFDTKGSGVASPLHDNHAYAILDVYERDGQQYVKVYNPWGVNDGARDISKMEHEMKIEDLIANGSKVHVNGG